MNRTVEQTIVDAEELLGNNLWKLTDLLDLHIRQGNRDAIKALADIEAAWVMLAKAKPLPAGK